MAALLLAVADLTAPEINYTRRALGGHGATDVVCLEDLFETHGGDCTAPRRRGQIINPETSYNHPLMPHSPTFGVSILMPVRNITSVMFGGDELDVLYVTSMARIDHPGGQGLFIEEEKPQPHAGGLFAVSGLGVRGVPEPRLAG